VAAAKRDVGTIYQLLIASVGITQKQIAELTGQWQSEVSEVIGGRPVGSYDVLVRIAEGLGIPRGWMGLAVGDKAGRPYGSDQATTEAAEDEDVRRRKALATAAGILLGSAVLGEVAALEWLVTDDRPSPPGRIGETDVAALRALTGQLRELARGGHPGMPEVYGQVLHRAEALLDAKASEFWARKLRSALAELHTDAGWYAYDVHQTDLASWHYSRAIRLGKDAGDAMAVAVAAWSQASGYRELGAPNDAIKLYQLAHDHLAASPIEGRHAVLGELHLRMALSYADLARSDEVPRIEIPSRGPAVVKLAPGGLRAQAAEVLARSQDCPSPSPGVGMADRAYARAALELAMGRLDSAERYASNAVVLAPAGPLVAACPLVQLATIRAIAGDSSFEGAATSALDVVSEVRSVRARAMLAPLETALAARRDSTSRELAQRARALRTA
jgi:transcriptional regulator with XRE-family HTH domain